MELSVVETAGVLAATLITLQTLPQVRSTWRAADISGVSTDGAFLAVVSCAAWAWYAVSEGLTVVLLSSVFGVVGWGSVVVTVGVRANRWPRLRSAWWPATVASSAVVGTSALLVVLLAEALTNTVPQLLRARASAAGVSVAAWSTMCAGASAWVVYGIGHRDLLLVGSQAVKATLSALIVTHAVRQRRSAPPTSPAPPPTRVLQHP